MWCEYDLERVIVDAPNAFSVIVGGRFVSHVMSVSTCKNVRWLKLGVLGISDEWLTYEISQFPFLEYLHIERAQHLQNLKISSPSLEVLCMDRCESVIDIKVNTHNLSTFRSIGNITAFSSTDHLALLATDLRFPSRNLDNEWFVQYIGLLTQFYQLSQVLNFAKRDRQGKVHGSLARAGKVRGQTPKVAKQDKKKKPRGRAHKRMQYNRRFVTAVVGFGKKRGPNSSEK
ncbi:40S ribosomal protein S30 [Melia azedarach]|uniref:40S ribosomal protein S30 n=1 Tax=Melia azedarach TaxID=155640 RepID=A0ACC1Y614_MELAZ|nr:40S ribosomal protein S30 [Melia azedarach]